MKNKLMFCLIVVQVVCVQNVQEPDWATESWKDFAEHIVGGEIPEGCRDCALLTACTIVRDAERGWDPWALKGRWYGWGYSPLAEEAVKKALRGGCRKVPNCKYLGNESDYINNWSPRPKIVRGNKNGKSVCVLWEDKNDLVYCGPSSGPQEYHPLLR